MIMFKTFAQICKIIVIISTSCQKEMGRKCGKGTQGEILRILGNYEFDEKDESAEVSFFAGTSFGTDYTPPIDIQTTGNQPSAVEKLVISNHNTKADRLFLVLTRKSREWNDEDNRFIHNVKMRKAKLPDLVEECDQKHAFSISWRRAAETTPRNIRACKKSTYRVLARAPLHLTKK